MTKNYLLIAFIIIVINNLSAQDNNIIFEHLKIKDGLSQSTVYSILQDQKGFMWFGTQDRGLNKYDAYSFTIYTNNPLDSLSISSNRISKIIQDKKGNIWIGTWGGGLCKYIPEKDIFINYLHNPNNPNSISQNKAQTVYEDFNGNIWIGTVNGGLNKFDPTNEVFTHYKYNPLNPYSISNDRIWSITQDKKGNLWIATSNGLCKMFTKDETFVRYLYNPDDKSSISHKQVRTVFIDKSETIWVGTAIGLDKFDPKTEKFSHFIFPTKSKEKNSVNIILDDHKGSLWIGTHIGGLYKFNPTTSKYINYIHDPNNKNSIGYNDVRDIFEDNSKILWISTRGGGIDKIDLKPKKFNHFAHIPNCDNSLSNNRIKAIFEDKEGILWIGTDVGGGLDKFDRKNNKFTHYFNNPYNPKSISSNDITAITEDKFNNIWIGTDGSGINIFNRKTNNFTHLKNDQNNPKSLCHNDIWTIFEDNDGFIWLGTDNGLDRYDWNNKVFIHYKNNPDNPTSISNNQISIIYQDTYGGLWIGTDNGLNKYIKENDNFINFKNDPNNPNTISCNTIISIYEDEMNNFWIGTINGLNKFDRENKNFICYSKKEGLIGNAVHGIVEDNSGNLWVSTVNGLSKFDPYQKKFKNYDIYDGLQNNDFAKNANCKSYTGELIFGGINGFNIFSPDSIKDNPFVPPIVITDFQIFNKSIKAGKNSPLKKHINYTSEIHLSYKHSVISFHFSALNYTKTAKNKYEYKLEGFDKNWINIGTRRFVSYTNIDNGTYFFRVRGSNNDGVWNKEGVSIKIIKNPPFWETIVFYVIIIIIFFLLIYGLFKLRLKSLRNDKKYLEEKVNDRTREINFQKKELEKAYEEVKKSSKSKELFLANTSHEIRTPLNVIIGYTNLLMNTIKNTKQLLYVNNIRLSSNNLLVLINDILDFSKIEAGKLSIKISDFVFRDEINRLYDLMLSKANKKQIQLNLYIDKNIPDYISGDPVRLSQILTNLVDNAIKFTNTGGLIVIHIELIEKINENAKIIFKISDTGIGISKQKIDNIFDSFTQATNNTNRKYGGTGLGLAIVKKLIELQNGKIFVESEINKGSTFTFILDYKISTGKNIIKKTESYKIIKAKHLIKLNILLVEDNDVNATLAIDTIKMYNKNIKINVAQNGKIALEKIKANNYDLVIMDVQMPVMDGYEATKIIRNEFPDNLNKIPILGMSAHAMKEEKEKCLNVGMNDYLTKPFVPENLLNKIYNLLKFETTSLIPQDEQFKENIITPASSIQKHYNIDISIIKKTYDNDINKVKKILIVFKDYIPKQIDLLQQNHKNKNQNKIKTISHSLKISFNYLRLKILANLSDEIKNMAVSKNNYNEMNENINSIINEWNSVENELKSIIDKI
ncbi:MAG: response regulator [Bacteroidales bacterium]|nr:response regulator [Bacteroidales bacterium]